MDAGFETLNHEIAWALILMDNQDTQGYAI